MTKLGAIIKSIKVLAMTILFMLKVMFAMIAMLLPIPKKWKASVLYDFINYLEYYMYEINGMKGVEECRATIQKLIDALE